MQCMYGEGGGGGGGSGEGVGLKGQVRTRHSAPAAPALPRPSLPSQFHSCSCCWDSSFQFCSLTSLNQVGVGCRLSGSWHCRLDTTLVCVRGMACMPCSTMEVTALRVCLLVLALLGHIPFVQLIPGAVRVRGGQSSTDVVAATNHGFTLGPLASWVQVLLRSKHTTLQGEGRAV